MRAFAVRTLTVFGTLLAALAVAAPAQAAFPGANGDVAFASNRDGNFEIYTMEADGTAETRRTTSAGTDVSPAWSPDGTKIAFTSERDGNFEIYTMNADGTGQTRRTVNAAADVAPSWSPDGTKIAFGSLRDGNSEIYTMNADGTGAATRLTNNAAVDGESAWSPLGDKIAFISNRDGNFEIYVMNADGSGTPTRLTTDAGEDRQPAWAPTGSTIYFASNRTGVFKLWYMSPNGTNQNLLGGSSVATTEPAASPDGQQYVYEVAQNGGDIWRSDLGSLTNNAAADSTPDWQPAITGYARPGAATPKRDALVLAYKSCVGTPNTTHEGPLGGQSCVPAAQQVSDYLTVGTPDANGAPAKSVGSVRMSVVAGNPLTPANEADVKVVVSITDVRRKSDLADFTGSVGLNLTLRITDRRNAPSNYAKPGTLKDPVKLRVTVSCAPTADTTVGSTCAVNTTMNTLFPNSVKEGKRAIWQIDELVVIDGGADGVASTDPNTVFATSGLFIP